MITEQKSDTTLPVSIQYSIFDGKSGVKELHIIVTPIHYGNFDEQLKQTEQAYRRVLEELETGLDTSILRRFFCSDLPNQAQVLCESSFSNPEKQTGACAISWVNQPPAHPAKIALWAYHIIDPLANLEITRSGSALSLKRGDLTHHWDTNLYSVSNYDSYSQSKDILESYCQQLDQRNATLFDNVIRTWFFVKDVDTQYKGLVEARNDIFEIEGLNADTHYIASTGIAGGLHDTKARVAMDAYAITGVLPAQIDFIAALDHLSPTQLYGVAFERATSVSYRDRKHIFISGTASIDWQGKILHEGNVLKQLNRTLENMEALLDQANATLEDCNVFIVYLRDMADQFLIQEELAHKHPEIPTVFVHAPVCRPGWLIEIEAIATTHEDMPNLPAF